MTEVITQPFLADFRTSVMGVSDVGGLHPLNINKAATATKLNTFFISFDFLGLIIIDFDKLIFTFYSKAQKYTFFKPWCLKNS